MRKRRHSAAPDLEPPLAPPSRSRRRTGCRALWRRAALLAEAGLHQLWRPRRADCHHAHRTGRAPPLDQRAALPARAELLHAAARPRGAATGHLHRLAAASHVGRHRRRRAVRAALVVHSRRPELGLPALRRRAGGGRVVLWPEARGDGAGAACGPPHRHARAEEPLDVGHRRAGLRRHLCVRHTLSGHRGGGGADRPLRGALGAAGVCTRLAGMPAHQAAMARR